MAAINHVRCKKNPDGKEIMAHFNPPLIQDNPNGWGPSSLPEQFQDMPYQPFSKGDRLGKVSVSVALRPAG